MSEETSTGTAEPDQIEGRAVWIALAIAGTAIAASVLVVWLFVRAFVGGGEAMASPGTVVPPSVPFEMQTAGESHAAVQRAQLRAWSWADPEHTRVRLPISAAIDRELGAKP